MATNWRLAKWPREEGALIYAVNAVGLQEFPSKGTSEGRLRESADRGVGLADVIYDPTGWAPLLVPPF